MECRPGPTLGNWPLWRNGARDDSASCHGWRHWLASLATLHPMAICASTLPMMKLRFAQPGHLIDLGRIGELKGIREVGGMLRIGAMTTENEIIWSKLLQDKCPLLVEGARLIADPQVRYKGTIGGDISHGDPGNDHPALMLVLGATFVLKGLVGRARGAIRWLLRRQLRHSIGAGRNHDRNTHPGARAE
jgi:CO/xanthine dehydrogenase FAD-binding subunit